MNESAKPLYVQRRGDDALDCQLYGGEGHVAMEWYFQKSPHFPVEVLLFEFEPGCEEGQHLHSALDSRSCSGQRDANEMYVVVEGEVIIECEKEQVVLRAGDAAYTPTRRTHGVINKTESLARVIVIFT